MDPITPPPLAQMIVPGFSRGTYVEFPYSGHGPTRSVKCAGEFLTKFFDAPEADVDRTCPESLKAPDFSGRLYRTDGLLNLVLTLSPVARIVNRDIAAPTFGARPLGWLTALLGVVSIGGLGAAVAMTVEANEMLMLGGLIGWARWFVIAGYATGLAGLGVLALTVRARLQRDLPIGTLTGLLLIGAAGLAFAIFLAMNGMSPI
jgi:hypothetical protein